MTVVGTATARTGMSLLDGTTTALKTDRVQNLPESPPQGTLGKDHIPPSATVKITATETTTGTTVVIGTGTTVVTGTGTTVETGTDTTVGIGTGTTVGTGTDRTGRFS